VSNMEPHGFIGFAVALFDLATFWLQLLAF